MLKKILIVLLFITMLINVKPFNSVFAEETQPESEQEQQQEETVYLEVTQSDVRVRTGPSTSYAILQINGENQYYVEDVSYKVIGKQKNEKNELWYNVINIINNIEYQTWVREDYVILHYYELDEVFEQHLENEGFPEEYRVYLRYLHTLHPNWIFKAFHTNTAFATILQAQDVLGKSLIDGSNLALRSTRQGAYDPETGQYIALDGYSWYQANTETIAYFMDPRNFLNEKEVFQFLKLSFNETEQPECVQQILNITFMKGEVQIDENTTKSYATLFYEAGQQAQTSPIFLAVKARNEQGVNGSAAVDGREFEHNGVIYSNIYNFYNIHAYSGKQSWKNGLIYAAKEGSYGRPWNTIEKSIKGGALWIADGYINKGQDTLYYQKYNCATGKYWHQYATNVRAAFSEGRMMYTNYRLADILEEALTFSIPIYLEMPEKTALPTEVVLPEVEETVPNEEYYTGDLILDLDLQNDSGHLTGFDIGISYQQLLNRITLMNTGVNIRIERKGAEKSKDLPLSTGDALIIIGDEGESTYTVIIKGDIDGDGIIGTLDYLIYRKALLEIYEMNNIEKKAAEINGETGISTLGYLHLRKYLLEIGNIEQ
ncbi:MAG: N-acetylglucosaminidase [Erysipelotrichaceae bacterium]